LPRKARRELGRRFAPRGGLHRIFHLLTAPAVTLSIYVAMVAVWHLPMLYDKAQGPAVIHELEHLVFLGAGLLFWWPVVHPTGGKRRLGDAFTSLYLLVGALDGGLISGALLALSRPIYATYREAPRVWGISPLADQELGAMMMMLGDAIFIFAALWLFVKYVTEEDRAARALEAADRAARAEEAIGRPAGD
jgi:putative membrane protein